jgi:PPM family protein phosphatase
MPGFFQRLFSRKVTPDRAETAPLDPHRLAATMPSMSTDRFVIGSAQSTGLERGHNEDALFVMASSSAGEESLPEFGIFIVADGMGGHRAGEIASAVSVRTLAHRITSESIVHLFDPEANESGRSLEDLMRQAMQDSNQVVVERVPGGGTTLTAVVLIENNVTIGHVGDSRAYEISHDQITPLTRDHSLVERLVELGQITTEEAAVHPQRNVLYRAIGQGSNLEVDVTSHTISPGSYLLICSDGLWGVVPELMLQQIVLSAINPQAACEQLVEAANAAGGPDNITAVLVYFPE